VDPLRTEEEQLEALKQWWDDNGKTTVAAVVLAVAGWGGWDYWQDRVQAHREAGSATFAQLQTLVASEERSDVQDASIVTLADSLKNDFADLGYSSLASFEMAKFHADNGDYELAVQALESIDLNTLRPELKGVAVLRLARAKWASGDAEGALSTLDSVNAESFASIFEELRGDISLSRGDVQTARAHYVLARQIALRDGITSADQRLMVLDMKVDSLLTATQDAES
jgi:predicted negative regulator of RcsB-dependent stress response